MHGSQWPDQRFVSDLTRDFGEKNNVAAADLARTARLQRQRMDGLKTAGAYFPKPNPNADPKAKRYDPTNLADQGESGDPAPARAPAPPAGAKKRGPGELPP